MSLKAGKLSINEMRSLLNKKAGMSVAHDLTEENPTEVKEWISTGSTWLDSIICRGKKAGIPVGKISEVAGEEATGKSYLAAQVAANAQKQGIVPVYFDSDSAIDPKFLQSAGCDLENLIYIQAVSVEAVLEQIEELIKNGGSRFLFIWDSLAMTPTITDVEGDFNPQSSMAVKARILSKGFAKLTIPIAESKSTLLILNQLKLNITGDGNPKYWTQSQKFFTPGGKSPAYAYSLRIWLTGSKAKDSFVNDAKGYRIGSLVKARLEKSRFGTQGRACEFQIMWADKVGVLDDESLFEAIKSSPSLTVGAWNTLVYQDGTIDKFRAADWAQKMKEPKFRERIFDLLNEEVILKFDKREGMASEFYEKEAADPTDDEELA
jgi:recombination protein RecA